MTISRPCIVYKVPTQSQINPLKIDNLTCNINSNPFKKNNFKGLAGIVVHKLIEKNLLPPLGLDQMPKSGGAAIVYIQRTLNLTLRGQKNKKTSTKSLIGLKIPHHQTV